MYYYQKNIGDYRAATAHLSLLEHGVYNWLMDTYYSNETPLPLDERTLFRLALARSDDEKQAVRDILDEFFTKTDDGWIQSRCDKEIAEFQLKSEKAKKSASARWDKCERNANASETHNENKEKAVQDLCDGNANQEPLTNNHKPITKDTQSNLIEESAEDFPEVCRSLRGLGVSIAEQRQNLDKITGLIHRGATLEHFTAGLAIAKDAGKGLAYSLGVVKGRLDDAEKPQQARASPKQSKREILSKVPNIRLADLVEQKGSDKDDCRILEAK